jgi:sterol carrier protein 2
VGNKVKVIGVGMVKCTKPGTQKPYEIMAGKAIREAFEDAGISMKDVQQAFASYVYGDSTVVKRTCIRLE